MVKRADRGAGGAEIVTGGHRPDLNQRLLSNRRSLPGRRRDSEIVQDEVFGPVVTVQRVPR